MMTNAISRLRRGALAATLATAATLSTAAPMQWSASTLPADGNISGAAGTTIGWGYSITNEDDDLWLVLTAVAADAMQHAVGLALFDLPVLAPGSTAASGYDGTRGLFELTWDAAAPEGFVNFGSFILSAEWWDGDPLTNGHFVGAAADAAADYSATVRNGQPPNPAPLPSTAWLCLLALALALRRRPVTPAC